MKWCNHQGISSAGTTAALGVWRRAGVSTTHQQYPFLWPASRGQYVEQSAYIELREQVEGRLRRVHAGWD